MVLGSVMANQIPLVDYLVLGDDPYLIAHECTSCGAQYFGRRNACASCFATEFKDTRVANEGTLRTFSIVAHAAPGIPVPFVSAIVDCDGTAVRANVINTDPTPESIKLGMKLRLATFPVGEDEAGTEAVGFGYEPVS
jgi:uncharacterized OB-fold protein